jgi:predicted dehydrogenase
MSKSYRVGVIGFAHMHINSILAHFANHPQVHLVAGADTLSGPPELRSAPYTRGWNLTHALNDLGLPKAYDDYQAMLAQEEFDIILCCSENATHADVVDACAARGIHILVEKPMATSLADAERMLRACQDAGVALLINWPITWQPYARKTRELIDQGLVGRVLEVKWRGGSTGPLGPGARHAGVDHTTASMSGEERGATWWHQQAAGGGAMLDYCCYGCMVSRWYIGEQATAALGMKVNLNSPWADADDNAAMLVRFPHAMGLFEASWTTWDHGVSTGPIVYGTEGTLVVDTNAATSAVRLERGGGHTTLYEYDPLPAGRTNVAQEFILHLQSGEPLHPTLDANFNLQVMAILDAGIRSAESGKMEEVAQPR